MKNKKFRLLFAILGVLAAAAGVLGFLWKKKQKTAAVPEDKQTDMPDNYPPANPFYRDHVKRWLDVIICVPILIVSALPLLVLCIAIKLESEGPAVFRQKRLGLGGKEFEFLKLRSMVQGAEKTGSGVYSNDLDPRITRIGHFLRSTSIDELPQLINIIRGDMSLIGPRPPLTYHPWPIEEYSDEQRRMFEVRPGITGWAQTHGRKDVEWHHRIDLNVWYVEHVTFRLDLKIFLNTILKVFTNADNENRGETLKKDAPEESRPMAEEV